LVLAYTDPGDWVLDPFAGSGTTGAAALKAATG
jgi:DNA modification methylase